MIRHIADSLKHELMTARGINHNIHSSRGAVTINLSAIDGNERATNARRSKDILEIAVEILCSGPKSKE